MHSGKLIRSLPPNPGSVTALYVLENDDFLITAGTQRTSETCPPQFFNDLPCLSHLSDRR